MQCGASHCYWSSLPCFHVRAGRLEEVAGDLSPLMEASEEPLTDGLGGATPPLALQLNGTVPRMASLDDADDPADCGQSAVGF